MPELEPMEIIETVCSVCQMPATRVSGQWLHVDFGDAVFCKTIMRGVWDELDEEGSDEERDARAEQAYESRYNPRQDRTADND